MVRAELAERFLSAPMLAGVEFRLREALLDALKEERAEKGAVLLQQGQPNDHLSFLIAGSATIERKRGGPRAETLATLTAPSVFGTTSFFRPDPPTFTHPALELFRGIPIGGLNEAKFPRYWKLSATRVSFVILTGPSGMSEELIVILLKCLVIT